MVPNSKPSSTFNHISMVRYVVLVLISMKSSNGNIISITRLPNQDDSINVMSQQGLLCPPNTCSKYNANQGLSGISDSCLCQCSSPLSTFYSKTYSCVKSKDIVDEHGCNIKFKDDTFGILPVIDILSTSGSLHLENKTHGGCSKIRTSWFYLKNGTWYMGKNGVFSVTLKQHWTRPDKWLLKWYSGLHSNYSGIIIKVLVTCEHDNILDDNDKGCLMFKSRGTFKVKQTNIIPTTQISTTATPKPSQTTTKTESTTKYQPTQTTVFTTKTQVMPTSNIQPTQTTTPILRKEPRKEGSTGDQKIWIAFAAGGVTILFVMVGILVFFFLMCRQRKKQISRTEIGGQSSTRTENANDPLHDYEYVVYPELTDGYQSESFRLSLDNAMYGRGPDNELIIRTPGISMESLATNSINHNRDGYNENKRSLSAYYPRDIIPTNHVVNMSNTIGNSSHEYAQLQRKEAPVDSSGIYQPLIRPVTPEINDDRPDENQAISLEPITKGSPDYMVLEPADSSEQDLSA